MKTGLTTASLKKAVFALACSLLVGPVTGISAKNEDHDDTIRLEMILDKPPYHPGGTLRVKLLVINNADQGLYLFRGIGQCSSQIGSLYVVFLDDRDRNPAEQRCSSDVLMSDVDVVQELTSQKSGLLINKNEIYGDERLIDLPARKGIYHLEAKLVPVGFPDEQNQELARHHIRVPRRIISSPTIAITVK